MRTTKMRLIVRVFPLTLILIGAALLFERPAYAYADPGSGLLAVQAIGSALIAGGWYLRKKIYSLFRVGEQPKTGQPAMGAAKDGESSPLQ
jgi:hypothetical protein